MDIQSLMAALMGGSTGPAAAPLAYNYGSPTPPVNPQDGGVDEDVARAGQRISASQYARRPGADWFPESTSRTVNSQVGPPPAGGDPDSEIRKLMLQLLVKHLQGGSQ